MGALLINLEVYPEFVSSAAERWMKTDLIFRINLLLLTKFWHPFRWSLNFWSNKIFIANGAFKFESSSFSFEICVDKLFRFFKFTIL